MLWLLRKLAKFYYSLQVNSITLLSNATIFLILNSLYHKTVLYATFVTFDGFACKFSVKLGISFLDLYH